MDIPCDVKGLSRGPDDGFEWYQEIQAYDDQLRRMLLSPKLLNTVPEILTWYDEHKRPRDVFYYVIKAWYVVVE